MKKVMFLLMGLLLSFSVSAATITLSSATVSGFNFPTTSDFIYADEGNVEVIDVVTDEAATAAFTFSFRPDNNALSSVGFYTDGNLVGSIFNSMLGDGSSTISFVQNLILGVAYSLHISSVLGATVSVGVNDVAASISAVPIPAALWLFAPALVGFFGFRRKAAVAA